MSDDSLTSDASFFACDLAEGDYLEVHRVGEPGLDTTVISLSTVVEDWQELELATHLAFVGTIMVSPQAARILAVTLIELADEADGIETSFFPANQVEEATDGDA